MATGASRFRKLAPPRIETRGEADERPAIGDLFEHFGVNPDGARGLPGPIVAASPCSSCGWLRRADELDGPCPLCAAPPDSTNLP